MRDRSRRLLVPALLILLGAGLLLENFGVVEFNVWQLFWRLWPLWLIVVGVTMMMGRTGWRGWDRKAVAGPGEVVPVQHPLGDAQRAEVEIQAGVARLQLRDLADGPYLAAGEIRLADGSDCRQEYRVAGDIAHLSLREHSHWSGCSGSRRASEWDLALRRDLPTDLRIGAGVGTSNLDLSRLLLTNLRLRTGVGQHSVTMPAQGSLRAEIASGVGELIIRVPAGRAVRITVRKGIGAVHVSGDFRRDGSTYESPGYAQASERLDVHVAAGVGAVSIQTV